MTTVQHKSLRETVTDAIREMILNKELAGGERLVEDRLAEMLGVSRNPVREAIRALESTGLVQVVPRHGAHVAEIDIADARSIQEVRQVLEAWIVATAAERHDEGDLAAIDKCLTDGIAAAKAGNVVEESRAHRSFHLAIEAATKNDYAGLVMEPLRQRTELVFTVVGGRSSTEPHQWQEHQNIRDAIANRDSALAQNLIRSHIEDAIKRYENVSS
jgi:DNA-binding GntR family transcriptional regulator